MHQKILLEEALKELDIHFTEDNLKYVFNKEISLIIATPQTQFSFNTKNLHMSIDKEDDDCLCMDFGNNLKFRTKAPFVTFTPSNGTLLIRLSHTKY